MDQFSHYCILKTYKGIFRKKHSKNIQLIITNVGRDFMGLIMIGYIDEDIAAHQMMVRGPAEHMDMFLTQMKEDENFMVLESLKVNVKEINKGTYKLSYPKKGTHIKSDLKLEFEPEYSRGDVNVYTIHGKLDLVFEETIGEKQVGMKALKKKALFKSAMRSKMLKGV